MSRGRALHVLLMALRHLAHRRLATSISVLAIALSLVFVAGVATVDFALKKTAVEGAIRYPLIVGPSGSSGVQLILSTLFHIDKPAGTLPSQVHEELSHDPRVIRAYPVAVADTYMNVRIVGTDQRFLDDLGVGAAAGSLSLADVGDAVLGADAARRLGLTVGARFEGQHGMVGSADAHVHDEAGYEVVGVLRDTGGPEDGVIYTHVRTVWAMHDEGAHGHEDPEHDHSDPSDRGRSYDHPVPAQDADDRRTVPGHGAPDRYHLSDGRLTAVLVRTSNPAFTGELERAWSMRAGTTAVDTGKSMRDFVDHLNKGEVLVEALTAGTLAISMLLILVTLIMSLNERRKELALLRCLGIGRLTLALCTLAEALLITLGGVLIGLVIAHVGLWWVQPLVKARLGVVIEPFVVTRLEWWGVAAALIAGQILGLIGLVWTYRMNLIEEIARD
jgi:putative ABC transport system permease protein